MRAIAWSLTAIVAGCAPPPDCAATCREIVEECGLGDSLDLCLDGCRATPISDQQRHDVRDCVMVADCGHLAAGHCVGAGRCETSYLVVVSEDCLDGPRSVGRDDACDPVSEGGWGDLGPPRLSPEGHVVFQGECTTDPESPGATVGTCVTPAGQVCDFAVWPVL